MLEKKRRPDVSPVQIAIKPPALFLIASFRSRYVCFIDPPGYCGVIDSLPTLATYKMSSVVDGVLVLPEIVPVNQATQCHHLSPLTVIPAARMARLHLLRMSSAPDAYP